jgi:hypothetical protein
MCSEFVVVLNKGILQTINNLYETSSSHEGVEKNSSLLDYDAVCIGM